MRRFAVPVMPAAAVVIFAIVCAASACGTGTAGSDAAVDCPDDIPAACPSVAPTWTKDVSTIIASRCGECHTGSGVEAGKHNFETYDKVYAQRTSLLTQVGRCKMPPAGEPQLTVDERAAILGWLVCRAPEN